MKPREIVKRFNALHSERRTVEQDWNVIERFVAPYRGKMFRDNSGEHGIEWRKREIYDATAIQAHIQLAASLHGAATNPAIQWFELRYRDKQLHDNHQARSWL